MTSPNEKPRYEDTFCNPVCRESDCSRPIMERTQAFHSGVRKILKNEFSDKAKKMLPDGTQSKVLR